MTWQPSRAQRGLFVRTFGCQMNVYDSQRLTEILGEHGFVPVNDPARADLVFLNTCTVRQKAEQKGLSYLGRLKVLKRRRPGVVIAMGGCVAQQYGEVLLRRYPQLDLVVGTHAIGRVPAMLARYHRSGERQVIVDFTYDFADTTGPEPRCGAGVSAYVTIMRGCNNFCTYCIVPRVRGRECSRPATEILREVELLVDSGVREVTLLGQNVNSYGRGLPGEPDFPGLLRRIARIKGLRRLRFTTSHPKDVSRGLMRCFAELEVLCPHIHLPVQSGSDRILLRMKRGYSREHYLGLVAQLRALRPDVALSSDMIVGFPGESEEDFHQSLGLLERVRFAALYSFKYSDRPQTVAARLDGKIPEEVKLGRLQRLQSLQKRINFEGNSSQVGEVVPVLVEGSSRAGGSQLSGRTPHNRVVNFSGPPQMVGQEVPVLITAAQAHCLQGVVSLGNDLNLPASKERSWSGK